MKLKLKDQFVTSIRFTKEYGSFVNNPHQRSFSPKKVRSLMEKMKANGFPASMAISVYSILGGKFVINAGHHRLAAAKELGIAVPYVIEHPWSHKELSDEGALNSSWGMKDHVHNFAMEGVKDYEELQRLQAKGLPINVAASMLAGEGAGSNNVGSLIKAGKFKVKNTRQVEAWELMHSLLGDAVPAITHRWFVTAWSKCMFTPEFSLERFLKRLKANPSMLSKCATEDEQLSEIEAIYNRNSPNSIPLKFYVKENSKKRQRTFGRATAGDSKEDS
jgi:hypothetical protein